MEVVDQVSMISMTVRVLQGNVFVLDDKGQGGELSMKVGQALSEWQFNRHSSWAQELF